MATWIMVTSKEERLDGYSSVDRHQFQDGLNTHNNGLFFTKCDYLDTIADDDYWLRVVEIPDNEATFKISDAYVWRSNKIILGERHNLLDPDTVKKFNLNIGKYCMDQLSKRGDVELLEKWKTSGLPLVYTELSINNASALGHINVLQWWKDSGLELKYTNIAMDTASEKGLPAVLEWWKKSGLELKYSTNAIDSASSNRLIGTLNWWKQSELELKYTANAIDNASSRGLIDILNWWKQSGLEMRYTSDAIDKACGFGYIDVLKWWMESNLKLKYTKEAFESPLNIEKIQMLDEWIKYKSIIIYTQEAIDKAYRTGRWEIVAWLEKHGFTSKERKWYEKYIPYVALGGLFTAFSAVAYYSFKNK